MADKESYTAEEHLAVLESRIARETADITAERDALVTEKSDLATKLDIAESAKAAAETRATEAEAAFEAFKTDLETLREVAARKDVRIAKVREAAAHLDDKFFEDEARIERIVAMDEAQFEGYVSDLTVTAVVPGKGGSSTPPPRQTAMAGEPAAPAAGAVDTTAGRSFLMRDFVAPAQSGV